MELYTAGLSPEDFSPQTWAAMKHYTSRQEEVEYLKLLTIVTAVLTAGRIAGGGEPGDNLQKVLKSYKDAAFPEVQNDTLEKARRTEKIIKEEAAKGPLKFKALSYDKKKKRRR